VPSGTLLSHRPCVIGFVTGFIRMTPGRREM